MFESAQVKRSRERVEVSITLANGDQVDGIMFLLVGERLSDLLNDARQFLPVETPAGARIISKTQIADVRSFEPIEEETTTDPYEILRVQKDTSGQELRAAWMKRVKACHPDRLAALNLDPEIIQAARRVSQRINAAYDTILRHRKAKKAA